MLSAPRPRGERFSASPLAPERWQSGRSRRTRNAEYAQAYRGFESLPLRQLNRVARCYCWLKFPSPQAVPTTYPTFFDHAQNASVHVQDWTGPVAGIAIPLDGL